MYRIFFICIICITNLIQMGVVFAETCDIKADLPNNTELTSNIQRCILARTGVGESPNSITDFVCPQGEMFAANNQGITDETLAYLTSVNLAFNKTDIDIKKYMQKLQRIREPAAVNWIDTINSCRTKISKIYAHICTFGTLEKILNEGEKKYITTTNAYPQSLCIDLAAKKINGWSYLQYILMSDGISKNQKNSTDKWATEVKGAYARVLGEWHNYQKILARAASKMVGYTKESN